MNAPLAFEHRRHGSEMDWMRELAQRHPDQHDGIGMLVEIADVLRKLAVVAQEREALNATQIRLLILLDYHSDGLTPTVAAPLMDRSVPVIIEARNILLQRSLVEKVRTQEMGRHTYKITQIGHEMLHRLSGWADCLKSCLALLNGNDIVNFTATIRKIVSDSENQPSV